MAFNEGVYLFYRLNTFYFNVPSDAVDFFANTPSTVVRHIRSYEFECLFEGGDQKPIPDLDVLTSTLDRYLLHDNVKVKIKVKLDIVLPYCSFYYFRAFTQAGKEKTVEALGRFLSLLKLSAAIVIMPLAFGEEMKKMLETSGPHISTFFTVLLPALKHISNTMNGVLQPVLRPVWSCEGLSHDAISDQVFLIRRP
ncbi:hypothetical protein FAGAP_10619 [Fusarium agapanthi]|uniref:Uncharacterized protein n=1 Tax=Fusarium agapanthi TaxID=1803897 RepID=A0A9P5E7Z2_9HYPO|nr:hypothetical protein FAGAP_10619 [Fusarium agapanthi]